MQAPRLSGGIDGEAEGVVLGHRDGHGSSSAMTASPTSTYRSRRCAPCCTATAVKVRLVRFGSQGTARRAHPRDRRATQAADHRPPAQRRWRVARRAGRPPLRTGHPDPEERHRRRPSRARSWRWSSRAAVDVLAARGPHHEVLARSTIRDGDRDRRPQIRGAVIASRPETLARRPSCPTRARLRHEGRINLTDVPLVTIDGEDARDFDDAVYCEPYKSGRARTPSAAGG